MRRLRSLSLPWTVSNADVKTVATLPALEELAFQEVALSHRQFSDRAFLDFMKLGRLRRLVLPSGDLTDTSMEFIGALGSLEELDLHHNGSITGKGVAKLNGLTNLRSLRINGLNPDGVLGLKDLSHLKELRMSNYEWQSGKGNLAMLKGVESLELYWASSGAARAFRFRKPCITCGCRMRPLGIWIFARAQASKASM